MPIHFAVFGSLLTVLSTSALDIIPPQTVPDVDKLGMCHFPESFHGSYRIQDNSQPPAVITPGVRDPIQYRDVFVGPTAIPLWGDCVEKNGHQYLMAMKKVGGAVCYRCFVIIQRTVNILQVIVKDENRCYNSLDAAKLSCDNPALITPGVGMMLWRSDDVHYEYCPFGGRANFSYSFNDGRYQCSYPAAQPATISNCKRGYQLDMNFRSCSFPDYDLSMKCLGTWDAGRGTNEMFFALYNIEADEYRCGVLKDDRSQNGVALAALSNDSSCTSLLVDSSHGAETFVIYQDLKPEWPVQEATCSFPEWLQGDWEDMTIQSDLISYQHHPDPNSMTTTHGKCLGFSGSRFRLYSRTHCGDPVGYNCIWIEPRSASVIEFKMGNIVLKQDDKSLCNNEAVYANSTWTTLSRRKLTDGAASGFLGTFVSTTEDRGNSEFCFKFATNCQRNDTFKYTAQICGTDTVYDAREFRCLATWQENDLHYAYTVHTDDGSKACFVSQTVNGRLLLLWTGVYCDRNIRLVGSKLRASGNSKSFILQETGSCYNPTLIVTTGGYKERGRTPMSPIGGDKTTPRKLGKPEGVDYTLGDRTQHKSLANRGIFSVDLWVSAMLSYLLLILNL